MNKSAKVAPEQMPKADATVDRARKDGKELKRFCNRALSMLSLKLCLIRMIEFGEGSHIDSDRAWASAFEELSEPSVLKMIRFALACRNAKANADLIAACDVMVNSACSLIARYDEGLDVRIEMAQALKTFSKVFEQAARSDVFQEAQRRRWLFILEEASTLII